MNLLIIGNGFDLAHGLPTKYTDFICFCDNIEKSHWVMDSHDWKQVPLNIRNEFYSLIENNVWLKYFRQVYSELSDSHTWIDFEREIGEIVRDLDGSDPYISILDYMNAPSEKMIRFYGTSPSSLGIFLQFFSEFQKDSNGFVIDNPDITDMRTFIYFLETHLKGFARAFEIYCLMINSITVDMPVHDSGIKQQLSEIKHELSNTSSGLSQNNLRNELTKKLQCKYSEIKPTDYLSMSWFHYVLSFNYTDTYERLYGNENTQYCYIHGKAQSDERKSNIIFGIDDYLHNGDESNKFEWVAFKKYYQRIVLKTGSEYKDFLKQKTDQWNPHFVHIVGHSIDKTDHDVLYEIFSRENIKIVVYYYNDFDFRDKVEKVIQLLAGSKMSGRDELIRRVHGSEWTIKFTYLYDEHEGLFKSPA